MGASYYLLLGARQIVNLPSTFSNEIFRIIGITALLFLISKIQMSPKKTKVAIALGRRSFCLYAFHYPVLLVFNYFLAPETLIQFAVYCLLSSVSAAVVSELAFRLIDRRSIEASQHRRR